MALKKYRLKRNFKITSEPAGVKHSATVKKSVSKAAKAAKERPRVFVVQKHAARRLHYDFRLEFQGVLLSWAVPKGPSLDPAQRRLAVHVEDHPLEYGNFEGSIPAGQYGAGEVIVWDFGEWTPHPQLSARAAFDKGHIDFTLNGKKLKGAWSLVRMGPASEKENWLLVKKRDKYARPESEVNVVEKFPASVLSKRKIEELKVKNSKTSTKLRRR